MTDAPAAADRKNLVAHVAPFVAFLLLLGVGGIVKDFASMRTPYWVAAPEYWLYPLQTLICGLMLLFFRPHYDLGAPRKLCVTIAAAVAVFALWISPQAMMGFAPRTSGF